MLTKCGVATLCLYLSESECAHVYTMQVVDIDCAMFKFCVGNASHCIDFEIIAETAHSLLHHCCIACDYRTAFLVSVLMAEGTHHNLRADSGRIAHGDS